MLCDDVMPEGMGGWQEEVRRQRAKCCFFYQGVFYFKHLLKLLA
jgi:hypothetical protein